MKPLVPLMDRLMSKVNKTQQGCWLWTGGTNGRGYGVIGTERPRRSNYAHRVSYELHVGPIPDGMEVAHRCDVRNCVNPEHLTLMTHRENEADKASKGRVPRGERQWQSRLTETAVLDIRRRVKEGETRTALAKEYGTSASNVEHIVARRRWKHVP